jgi:hypothetical protein
MASQFFVINNTRHEMCLKTHKPHTLKWIIHPCSAHGWSLPDDANHDTKYKIKHDGHVIADIWIDHNGLLTGIKNFSKKIFVMSDEASHDRFNLHHGRNSDASALFPHPQEPISIIIRESCDH